MKKMLGENGQNVKIKDVDIKSSSIDISRISKDLEVLDRGEEEMGSISIELTSGNAEETSLQNVQTILNLPEGSEDEPETIITPYISSLEIHDDKSKEMDILAIDTTDKRDHPSRVISRNQQTFAAKKNVAQGMMDVALITANANQLRYLVEYQRNSPTFHLNVFLIVVSLLLQIAVGVSLIFKGRFVIKGKGKSPQARRINNYVVVCVFLITIINVFVAAFSVSGLPVNSLPINLQPKVLPNVDRNS